ncbi:Ni/Fe hydrogenase [Solemya velum gill symbiont]|uniref:hydrogenase small subunit n=1 Tax=Solemya velum gill symbiont TaxID=2340 RepID=UPI0009971A26|nr:hydrogenase small subunit [Solemya velum gill symbiont]OOZ13238.1 Ni/Fe hydrogenase [Solemya velum gill symbiont]OOZ18328.1 Ni/Fe hydrogenase [Solemya velum gill symbiont]OOZ21233.1 Ni/Fe hydrogenase [Solemya velum gill symbiont]OOZ22871.1 Ni/Fe hydrogenase [Solemya velum gill symbiont]OOZ28090.1 Ni/Fe hydrogenase [Solemya velum gill symbiont]
MKKSNVGTYLAKRGISRRSFLKYSSAMASLLALPSAAVAGFTNQFLKAKRPSVIWLSFQECTGCTESLTRSHAPTIEDLIFDIISLDYHHTLQAASGEAAESARQQAMEDAFGDYYLIVDGAVPAGETAVCSTISGRSNLDLLQETIQGAKAVIAIGSCAAFGGLPAADPNPTGAAGVSELMERGEIEQKPLINLPGCPPLPVAISSVLAHLVVFEGFPALDDLNRPLSIYAKTVHDRCSRYHFYENEQFAERFDDEGARQGWCLYKLGCKGPTTHNACAVVKWNQGTSFPIEAGHPCIGCSEPDFWDKGGFYQTLDSAMLNYAPKNEAHDSRIQEGAQLYEENCVYCHSFDPTDFKTAPDKIADLLRSGDIRSHSRLQFSEDQLTILEKYLEESQ